MAYFQHPVWALSPRVPDRAEMDPILVAYNAAKPAGDPVLARGDVNPMRSFVDRLIVHGASWDLPTSRNLDAVVRSTSLPWEFLDELVGSLAALRNEFQRIIAAGGDVQQYPLFVQFPAAALNSNMPAYIPNRSFIETDDSDPPVETEVIRTVGEYWSTSTNFADYPVSYDSDVTYWAPCADPWGGGANWPMSVIFQLADVASVNLRTADQFIAANPEVTP